ncbi:MAG: hypothetical protein HW380_1021 [Magnetococcales bacterium]|nr:hypothetical protein [Magnetococcales bacterium]
MQRTQSLKKSMLAASALLFWFADAGCGGSRGGSSSSSSSSSSASSSSASSSSSSSSSSSASALTSTASTSVVTVHYTGSKTLYGHQLQLTATNGLTLEKDTVCTFAQEGTFSNVNTSTKSINTVAPSGFTGTVELFTCTFSIASTLTQKITASDYSISTIDAYDEGGNKVSVSSSDYKITIK